MGRAWLSLLLACRLLLGGLALALEDCESGPLYTRKPEEPPLPLDHPRLRRPDDASSFTPEQVHLSFAGPGAVAVSWVTFPEDALGDTSPSAAPCNSSYASFPARRRLQQQPQPGQPLGRRGRKKPRRPSTRCPEMERAGLRSVVRYGSVPGQYDHEVQGYFLCYSTTEYDSGALHHAVIGDGPEGPLPPSTRLYYSVGDPARRMSQEFSFVSPPPVGAGALPYRLAVVGDLGQTPNSLSTLEHLEVNDPGSVIDVGDLSYADGFQPRWDSWGRLMEPHAATRVWMHTEGNHEMEVAAGATEEGKGGKKPGHRPASGDQGDADEDNGVGDEEQEGGDGGAANRRRRRRKKKKAKRPKFFTSYYSRFYIPRRACGSPSPLFYSYDVAGVHVLMLGTYADYGMGSEQYLWLQRDLAAVDRHRTPWVIALMHAPWYNSNYAHLGEGEPMRESMEGLLYGHGVDLVLAGHVHAYERCARVLGGRQDACAPMYINIGDGGNREGLDYRYLPQPAWSLFREPSYGHATLDLLNATHAAWAWHRNQDEASQVSDSVMLIRDPQCRPDERALRLAAWQQLEGSRRRWWRQPLGRLVEAAAWARRRIAPS